MDSNGDINNFKEKDENKTTRISHRDVKILYADKRRKAWY